MDSAAPMKMPKLHPNNKGMKNEFEVVGGVLQPIREIIGGQETSTQAIIPLLHLDITSKLLEMLNSIATFSGDGRIAVIEALSCLSILKKEYLDDQLLDDEDGEGYGMLFGGKGGDKSNDSFQHSNKAMSKVSSPVHKKDVIHELRHSDEDEEEDGEEDDDGERCNLQTLLQKWDDYNGEKVLDEYDIAALEYECKWNLYAPFGMFISVLDASTKAMQQKSNAALMQSKTPPPLHSNQVEIKLFRLFIFLSLSIVRFG